MKPGSWTIHTAGQQLLLLLSLLLLLLLLLSKKEKFNLEQTMKAQKGSKGIALLFFYLGTSGDGWSTSRPGRFTPGERDLLPIL